MDEIPASNTLPHDLWIEIFSKLPVKTLLQIRCVSKSWHKLITNDQTRSIKKLPPPMCGLFNRNIRDKIFTSLKSRTYIDPTSIDTNLSFMTSSSSLYPNFDIKDCCNGLLLLSDSSDYLYVCNPTTRRYAKLEKPSSNYAMLLLAFDPLCSVHYKIFSFRREGCILVDIYSSETGEWTEIQLFEGMTSRLLYNHFVFLDGMFYVLENASVRYGCTYVIGDDGTLLGRIRAPSVPLNEVVSGFLGRSQGNLHYAMILGDELVIWVLEISKGDEYVLKHRNSVRAIVNKLPGGENYPEYMSVLAIHPDLDVIFLKLSSNKLFSYNFVSSKLEEICDFEGGRPCFPYTPCYL